MTLSAVAARYANALADVVTSPASALRPQDAVSELRAFESTVSGSPELRNALMTPAVPGSRKKAVVGRLADILGLSRISRNFLFVLIDRRRIDSLSEIIHSLEFLIDERLGFARADVASARELTGPQVSLLSRELERVTGKRIRMRFTVDEALIGGVVARIGSTIYDGSVRGQLSALGRRLSAEG
jgi:F-type H+-transporting ATPase subunit delta